MKLKRTIYLLIFLLSCFINKAWATHERSGYMYFTHISGRTYMITVVTFTKESSYLADRKYLPVNWGDGFVDSIQRVDTIFPYPASDDIKENIYQGTHAFRGFGDFEISMTDPNRIAGITNISSGNSVNVPLCIYDSINIVDPSFFGYSSSPIMLNPPMQFGAVDEVFNYNPMAYDSNGDSLSYALAVPRQYPNGPDEDVPGFQWPDQVFSSSKNQESLDPTTGLFTWNSPQAIGIYNVDIIVTAWRNFNGHYYEMSTTDVDLQIIIQASYETPPKIYPVRDTCIVAGASLNIRVTASDHDTVPIPVILTASGDPFKAHDSATFGYSNTGINDDSAYGIFSWNTGCDEIRYQPYNVIFTAEADASIPLYAQTSMTIKVVAPPPQDLKDSIKGNSIVLDWLSPYTCASAPNFIGFSIWRKNGCTNLAPDTCNPTSILSGYTKIADRLRAYTYTDNSVLQGIDYSYYVVAEFADSTYTGYIYNEAYSLPSNEICAYLKKNVPIITNVSVITTNTATGSMYVAWSKPDTSAFDTLQYPGPYKYDIFRSLGFNYSNPVLVDSITAPKFYLLVDTTFVDTPLDTKDNPYSYRVKFYWDNDSLDGGTNIASSIYLSLVGNNHQIALSWTENVPWTIDSFVIYRQDNTSLQYNRIASTTSQSYVDKGLKNDTTYCYYVKSIGQYSIEGIKTPLIDSSQINCTVPVDSTRPCPPVLSVYNDCNSSNNYGAFINQLNWTLNRNQACEGSTILKYYIYYSPVENQPLKLIDSTQFSSDSSYTSVLSNTLAGCYAVTSVDSAYVQSYQSNVVCVNNCPIYNLPNVFTPNGDEHNDLFTPILPYQFIDHVDMHIFNRWGELVYETTDPMINWNGKDMKSGKDCPDGVYYYSCDVFEITVTGVIKVNPPLKGYIHILR